MEAHRIYLDHNATTPTDPRVVEYMIPFFSERFGNPSSVHRFGQEVSHVLDDSRALVTDFIAASSPDEIVFCAGGSEANNHAIIGAYFARKDKGNHIITTAIEHPAVLETCQFLEKQFGVEVTYLKPDTNGVVTAEQVAAAVTERTILVSAMAANNEVGTILPIAAIGKICREKGILFHSDAVQAVGKIPIHVIDMNIDMLSSSAHKFYGPKGVGFLYIRKGIRIVPLIHGGHQEKSRRAGTHNMPGIAGLAKALELRKAEMESEAPRLMELRERLWNGINSLEYMTRISSAPECLPGTLNACFNFIEGEGILLGLDSKGIAASTGSACTSGSLEPSHVLLAMGYPHEIAQGSVRFGLGRSTTAEEIDYVLEVLPPIVKRLREMSPLWSQGKPVDIRLVSGGMDESCESHEHE
jgi:cysteine desulfurase